MSEHIDTDATPPMGVMTPEDFKEQLDLADINRIRYTARMDYVEAAAEEFRKSVEAIAEGRHKGMNAELQAMNADALQRGAALAVRQTTSLYQMPHTPYGPGGFTDRF